MEKFTKALTFIDNALWLGIPDVLKGLLIVFAVLLLFRRQIKKYPWIFYIYPIYLFVLSIIFFAAGLSGIKLSEYFKSIGYEGLFTLLMFPRRYALDTVIGVAFITVVMFIGVLPKTKFVQDLFKIRKEMAIIGGFILTGHGIMRLLTAMYAWKNKLNIFLFISYGILGVILLVLIMLPWITSFGFIRKKINPKTWKKLQTYTSIPLFIMMLLFGILVNIGWAASSYTDFSTELRTITSIGDKPVNNLWQGYYVGIKYLSAKIYIIMLIAYIYLRIKKGKENKKV